MSEHFGSDAEAFGLSPETYAAALAVAREGIAAGRAELAHQSSLVGRATNLSRSVTTSGSVERTQVIGWRERLGKALRSPRALGATALASVVGVATFSFINNNSGVGFAKEKGKDDKRTEKVIKGSPEASCEPEESVTRWSKSNGWKEGEFRFSNFQVAAEERGRNAFTKKTLQTRADLVEFLNGDSKASAAARESILSALPEKLHRKALSGAWFVKVQYDLPARIEGNTYFSSGKVVEINGGRKVESGDIFWIFVDESNCVVIPAASARADCGNPKVIKIVPIRKVKVVTPTTVPTPTPTTTPPRPPQLKEPVPLPSAPGWVPADTGPGSGGTGPDSGNTGQDEDGFLPGENPNAPEPDPPVLPDEPINPPDKPSDGTVPLPTTG